MLFGGYKGVNPLIVLSLFIKIFSYLGVFESQTRRGTILCDHSNISNEALTWTFLLGEKEFDDLIELRKCIEQEAWVILCEKAAKNKKAIQPIINELNTEVYKMKKALSEKDPKALEEADYSFHQLVINASNNEQFIKLFQTLKAFTLEEIRKSNTYRNLSQSIYSEHMEILEAFKAGNREKVIKLFRAHIEKTKRNVKASLYSKTILNSEN